MLAVLLLLGGFIAHRRRRGVQYDLHASSLTKHWHEGGETSAPKVVLSYARGGACGTGVTKARQLALRLRRRKITSWFGEMVAIPHSEARLEDDIFGLLQDAPVFIAMLSLEYFKTAACLDELYEACLLNHHHGEPSILLVCIDDPGRIVARWNVDFMGKSKSDLEKARLIRKVGLCLQKLVPDLNQGHFFQQFPQNLQALYTKITVLSNRKAPHYKIRQATSVFPVSASHVAESDAYSKKPFAADVRYTDAPEVLIACGPPTADNGNAADHAWAIANHLRGHLTRHLYLELEKDTTAGMDESSHLAEWLARLKHAKCALFLLSPSFLGSPGCRAQLLRACNHFGREGMDRIVVIFIEPVDSLDGNFFGPSAEQHREANFARPFILVNPVAKKSSGVFQEKFDDNVDALLNRCRLLTGNKGKQIRKLSTTPANHYAKLHILNKSTVPGMRPSSSRTCGYTSQAGKACRRSVAKSSPQCANHTCSRSGCTNPKSSKASQCCDHASPATPADAGGTFAETAFNDAYGFDAAQTAGPDPKNSLGYMTVAGDGEDLFDGFGTHGYEPIHDEGTGHDGHAHWLVPFDSSKEMTAAQGYATVNDCVLGTSNCAYVSALDGQRCANPTGQGSPQCTNHTCTAPHCAQPKSSSRSFCDDHTSGGGGPASSTGPEAAIGADPQHNDPPVQTRTRTGDGVLKAKSTDSKGYQVPVAVGSDPQYADPPVLVSVSSGPQYDAVRPFAVKWRRNGVDPSLYGELHTRLSDAGDDGADVVYRGFVLPKDAVSKFRQHQQDALAILGTDPQKYQELWDSLSTQESQLQELNAACTVTSTSIAYCFSVTCVSAQ